LDHGCGSLTQSHREKDETGVRGEHRVAFFLSPLHFLFVSSFLSFSNFFGDLRSSSVKLHVNPGLGEAGNGAGDISTGRGPIEILEAKC
jgi:hypothetical protein